MRAALRSILLISTALAATACGGGGNSAPPPAATNPAQGFYNGTTSNGYDLSGVVLETGEYYVVYSNGDGVHGVMQGHAVANNGAFTSTDGVDFRLVGGGRAAATLSASYQPKQALSGTISANGQTSSFTAAYDASYDVPADLAAVVGNYAGAAVTSARRDPLVLSIKADGKLTGASGADASLCTFAGTVTPRATGKNVFNLTMTFNGGGCAFGTSTIFGYGLADSDAGGQYVLALGVLPDRSDGFLAVAMKQ